MVERCKRLHKLLRKVSRLRCAGEINRIDENKLARRIIECKLEKVRSRWGPRMDGWSLGIGVLGEAEART